VAILLDRTAAKPPRALDELEVPAAP
jgi:hypothetical protein